MIKAVVTTITNEEYRGDVTGLINLAYGKVDVPLSASNFALGLSIRIAPITLDKIRTLVLYYRHDYENGNSLKSKTYTNLYLRDALQARMIFYNISELYIRY